MSTRKKLELLTYIKNGLTTNDTPLKCDDFFRRCDLDMSTFGVSTMEKDYSRKRDIRDERRK